MPGSELIKEILKLGPDPIYLCLFYENDPSALVPFIRDSLSRDEQFIYIADDQTGRGAGRAPRTEWHQRW